MSELTQTYNELIRERMYLDKFFTMFLDKFERKMDPEKLNTPVWKLYRAKLKEYDDLSRKIKSTEYWLKKETNV